MKVLQLCSIASTIYGKGLFERFNRVKIVPITFTTTTTTTTVRPEPTRRTVPERKVQMLDPWPADEGLMQWTLLNAFSDEFMSNVILLNLAVRPNYFDINDGQLWDPVIGPIIPGHKRSIFWFRIKSDSPQKEIYHQRILKLY